MVMSNPLLSVIIPTHNRPQYLPRAVKSALESAPDGNVEVIVVPNGGDETWKKSLIDLLHDSRIIISPVERGHANVARNHGLKLAKGKYIRFLDDDDYFYPAEAKKQVIQLEVTGADICAGSIAVVDAYGKILNILAIHYQEDFIANILSSRGRTSPQFYVYRRSSIIGLFWDETINIGQDTHWTHSICRTKDWSWTYINQTVSSWVQHSTKQISRKYKINNHLKLQEKYKWDTMQILIQQNRLSSIRQVSSAEGMWVLYNAGFYLSPFFWNKVAKKINNHFPKSHINFHRYRFLSYLCISPLCYELLTFPIRWLGFFRRKVLIKLGYKSQWN